MVLKRSILTQVALVTYLGCWPNLLELCSMRHLLREQVLLKIDVKVCYVYARKRGSGKKAYLQKVLMPTHACLHHALIDVDTISPIQVFVAIHYIFRHTLMVQSSHLVIHPCTILQTASVHGSFGCLQILSSN